MSFALLLDFGLIFFPLADFLGSTSSSEISPLLPSYSSLSSDSSSFDLIFPLGFGFNFPLTDLDRGLATSSSELFFFDLAFLLFSGFTWSFVKLLVLGTSSELSL